MKTKSSLNLTIALTFTLILLASISIIDIHLKTPAAPNGIISFELAGNLNQSKNILNNWNERAKIYAGISLGLDYLFMVAYAWTLYLIITLLNKRLWKGTKIYVWTKTLAASM